MTNYTLNFERLYTKAKEHDLTLSSSVLAYFLLSQANLSDSEEKLIKATISKLDFKEMKTKLRKVFGKDESKDWDEIAVKVEDINLCDENEEEVFYGRYNYHRPYQRNPYRGRTSFRGYGAERPYRGMGSSSSFRSNWKSKVQYDSKGNKMRCRVCESVMHRAAECPDRAYYTECQDNESDFEVVLYQSNLLTDKQYNVFVAESSN